MDSTALCLGRREVRSSLHTRSPQWRESPVAGWVPWAVTSGLNAESIGAISVKFVELEECGAAAPGIKRTDHARVRTGPVVRRQSLLGTRARSAVLKPDMRAAKVPPLDGCQGRAG